MEDKLNYYIAPEIEAVRKLHRDILNQTYLSPAELLNKQAQRLIDEFTSSYKAVGFHLGCWSPSHIGIPEPEIMRGDVPSLEICQLSMAREYGYPHWQAVLDGGDNIDLDFESAIDAVITGELDVVRQRLQDKPALATQQSHFGHKATLLHYLGANGVETQRQISPYNAAAVASCLIEHGADSSAIANIYGGSDVRGLAETSAHPRNAGILDELLAVL